ncbi:Gem-associated protein 5 [Mortierella sp. NVP85]|nr:Gem-associated protein 5 [Mortierella sp. NVP85]
MDTVYPPSPQWYQPHSACLYCHSEDAGWLLYSFNNLIHVINPFTLKYQGVLQDGHSAKIHSIASRPLIPVDPKQGDRGRSNDDSVESAAPKMFVASGGEDSVVCCWDILKKQPLATLKKAHQKAVKAVEWTGDGRFIVSVRWNLKHNTGHFTKMNNGNTHNRVVYQIMTWPAGSFAFSISMDRKIVAWDLDNNRGIAEVDCIGGSVYALDIALHSPGKVAMALGNETIKVWNTLSQDEPYENITIERFQSKVRSVKWHPTDEETLCFGLENGKIGIIENIYTPADSNQLWNDGPRKKGRKGAKGKKIGQKQTVFQSYHEGPVTSMMWCGAKVFEAPVPELFDLSLRGSPVFVVSCGEGKILVSDSSHPTERSFNLEVALQRQNPSWYQSYDAIKGANAPLRRDLAIHPNEDILAIGNADGTLEVFELKYLKLVYVFQGHKGQINRLRWHCAITQSDNTTNNIDESRAQSYLLACGADDGTVTIHMLERFSARAMALKRQQEKDQSSFIGNGADASTVVPTTHPDAIFRYHYKGVSDLAWSPHTGSDSTCAPKLVSSSFDGSVVMCQLELNSIVQSKAKQDQSLDPGNGETRNETGPLPIPGKVPQKIRHQLVASYNGHQGQALTVHWSVSEVDRIFSGGPDWKLSCWDWKSYALTGVQVEELKKKIYTNTQADGKLSSSDQPLSKSTLSVPSKVRKDISAQDSEMSTEDLSTTAAVQSHQDDEEKLEEVERAEGGNDNEDEQDSHLDTETTQALKRRGCMPPQLDDTLSKRARTSKSVASGNQVSSGNTHSSPKQTVHATPTKKFTLFPTSTAAFQVFSKEKVHLEIIRLARNLYCRRLGQGGILLNEQEIEEARKRWRSMLEFFEKDKEEKGLALSRILKSDIDEMNLGDDDEKNKDPSNHTAHIAEDAQSFSGDTTNSTRDSKEGHHTDKIVDDSFESRSVADSNEMIEDTCPLETWQGDDSTSLSGDLVFYGSRESIKALAEMEAELTAKSRSHLNPGAVFTVGSGLGVFPLATPKQKGTGSQTKSQRFGQLGQIPVSYWLGDVPKIVDILSSLSDTELGIHDWIGIALSPMGGVEAWKTIMARTAAKFESAGEVHAAVLCYLGIGNVFEAVEVYRKQNLYREALMLLRIRLWDDDDVDDESDDGHDGRKEEERKEQEDVDMQDADRGTSANPPPLKQPWTKSKDLKDLHARILSEWGQQQERRNLYEQACKCQLTLAFVLKRSMLRRRDSSTISDKTKTVIQATPSVSLQTLARRGDPATLRAVAGLAILLQDPSQEERVRQYETAIAHKRVSDHIRHGRPSNFVQTLDSQNGIPQ